MNVNKVQCGQRVQLDERYIDIFSMQDALKEYMKEATEEVIRRRIELSRLIDKLPKPKPVEQFPEWYIFKKLAFTIY